MYARITAGIIYFFGRVMTSSNVCDVCVCVQVILVALVCLVTSGGFWSHS